MVDNDSRGNGGGSVNYGRYIGVGLIFLMVTAGSAVAGFFLDRLFDTLPIFLLLGVAGGFAVALYYVYLQLKKLGGS